MVSDKTLDDLIKNKLKYHDAVTVSLAKELKRSRKIIASMLDLTQKLLDVSSTFEELSQASETINDEETEYFDD